MSSLPPSPLPPAAHVHTQRAAFNLQLPDDDHGHGHAHGERARPGWVAVGVSAFVGVMTFTVVIATFGYQVEHDGWRTYWWTPPAESLELQLVALAATLLPLLVSALLTTLLATGAPCARLRQVTHALLWTTPLCMYLSMNDGGRLLYVALAPMVRPQEERALLALAITAACAGVAWGCARLALAVANLQPPAHLVRRPTARR